MLRILSDFSIRRAARSGLPRACSQTRPASALGNPDEGNAHPAGQERNRTDRAEQAGRWAPRARDRHGERPRPPPSQSRGPDFIRSKGHIVHHPLVDASKLRTPEALLRCGPTSVGQPADGEAKEGRKMRGSEVEARKVPARCDLEIELNRIRQTAEREVSPCRFDYDVYVVSAPDGEGQRHRRRPAQRRCGCAYCQ